MKVKGNRKTINSMSQIQNVQKVTPGLCKAVFSSPPLIKMKQFIKIKFVSKSLSANFHTHSIRGKKDIQTTSELSAVNNCSDTLSSWPLAHYTHKPYLRHNSTTKRSGADWWFRRPSDESSSPAVCPCQGTWSPRSLNLTLSQCFLLELCQKCCV